MPDVLPFRLAIDYEKKHLQMTVTGRDGHDVKASMDMNDIAHFMAMLSHCQHVLAHAMRGRKIALPMDPAIAFQPVSGEFGLCAYEKLSRLAVGDDPTTAEVATILQGDSGRITGYRMSIETAQHLAQGLLSSVEKTSTPPTKQ